MNGLKENIYNTPCQYSQFLREKGADFKKKKGHTKIEQFPKINSESKLNSKKYTRRIEKKGEKEK